MWENVHTTGMRVKARTGFEPVLRADDDDRSLGRKPARPASELPVTSSESLNG